MSQKRKGLGLGKDLLSPPSRSVSRFAIELEEKQLAEKNKRIYGQTLQAIVMILFFLRNWKLHLILAVCMFRSGFQVRIS